MEGIQQAIEDWRNVYDGALQRNPRTARRRYQPLPANPRGVSEVPEDGAEKGAEPGHHEGGNFRPAV